jgi:hypothetical protein
MDQNMSAWRLPLGLGLAAFASRARAQPGLSPASAAMLASSTERSHR